LYDRKIILTDDRNYRSTYKEQ